MKHNLDRTQLILLAAAALFVIVAVTIGIVSFQLGQQTKPVSQDVVNNNTVAPPPLIVTNTPTHTSTPSATNTPTATPFPTATPTPTPIVVIQHIDSLGRLETAEYTMQTVIDLENQPVNIWERILGTDKLMLVAEGEVVAGFDFTKVTEDDIIVKGTEVEINLPAPEILYSRIDNERTQIYERETGLFMKPDPSLESRARQLAEETLVKWAVERGIFDKAESTGKLQLESFLRALGFTDITINVEEKDL
ncbi:MAG: DUF4230 domain-containing protein [Anaerolineaceae bacterium]|nr:DUF4230 domain-containing protein [Anaerolineaceae bacterium]